jgi:hypothetical protein
MKSSKYQQGVLHEVLESNDQLPAFQHSRCQGNRKSNKETVIGETARAIDHIYSWSRW